VLALTLLLRREPLAPFDGTQWVVFLGGVKGTFSVVLEDEACVGLIIRARKLSSTWDSRLGAASGSAFLGGTPRLGRLRVVVEDCFVGLLDVPEPVTLVRLGARFVVAGACSEDLDCPRAAFPFDTEEAVGAVKDAGKLTGLVGDLGFSLTNPVSDAWVGLSGGGLVVLLALVLLAVVVVAGFLAAARSASRDVGLASEGLAVVEGVDFVGPAWALAAGFVGAADLLAAARPIVEAAFLTAGFATASLVCPFGFSFSFEASFFAIGLAFSAGIEVLTGEFDLARVAATAGFADAGFVIGAAAATGFSTGFSSGFAGSWFTGSGFSTGLTGSSSTGFSGLEFDFSATAASFS
jgi:hypothetical protein